ncbi:CBS domain-containing protein [Kribbella shirazensis]|uniref:CBS domain-containing protein n=1 Tax=Kribbella shirazensis TaxID=1105143 RepID=A0A7X5VD54_9ACTN|nr:CBS domain-containing protein [Kribbella shirazensis]NIK59050.1 CBS domain-containing protein [Kribbella shirazensis]
MAEPVVGAVMIRSPVTVPSGAPLKQVACALLTADACAVPVLAARTPIGVISEYDILANLEFHGGIDPLPILGAGAARRRRRQARATCARELMSSPAPLIRENAPIGVAVRRLSDPARAALCVVNERLELTGLLTRRELLAIYRRTDAELAAEVRRALEPGRSRPARDRATPAVLVLGGVVTLDGELAYRSQVEHAGFAASRVAGVVAVHNNLRYDVDDLLVTGF